MYQWIVLRYCPKLEPNSSKAVSCSQGGIVCDVVIVVPYIPAMHGRDVGYQSYQNNESGPKDNCFLGYPQSVAPCRWYQTAMLACIIRESLGFVNKPG